MNTVRKLLLPLVLALGVSAPAHSAIIELSLVVDASGSITNSDFDLQVDAYESIFSSGSFFDDFLDPGDTLWANVILFATNVTESISFTAITDNASAAAFGTAAGAITRSGIGFSTNTFGGVNAAVASIEDNGIDGDRLIIDVSTDGQPNNDGGTPGSAAANAIAASAAALSAGITVNAIGVGGGIGTTFLNDFTNAGGGFFVTASDFNQFEAALSTKLERELSDPNPVPAPAATFLLGLGLVGLGLTRRRKNRH